MRKRNAKRTNQMEKKEIKEIIYWIIVVIINYVPTFGLHLLVRPMWYKGQESCTSASGIELIFTILILPLYLIITNYYLAKMHKKLNILFILNGIIIFTCIFISAHLSFVNWADSIGSYNTDDYETLGLIDLERNSGIVLSSIGLLIIYLRVRYKVKIQKEIDNIKIHYE